METACAPAMAPGATKLEIPIVFAGSWDEEKTQGEHKQALFQLELHGENLAQVSSGKLR